ncbi:DUF2332 domain-containing protein [Micromonospora sp. 4G55]|uniref:DUF2332 domain-containing protein n=1 Tax=Micromonospora sp. 4G55 TaxID=2806102 RepID=UPI001A5AD796|nr:DUF2332 domain-containing protein [Micromonospora sp. 4G55]MBM0256139.1 DUF2332 domain-containing protein [Micromonospora sp. 4G55]
MDRTRELESLSEHFAQAPAVFTTSPLYQALSTAVAADQPTLEMLLERRSGQQASFLLFGAAHYLLLEGLHHDLRHFYPSVVGPDAADPETAGPVFVDFCRAFRRDLEELIRTRLVQSNVVRRAAGLRFALAALRHQCDGPVHLIEVGASAGIHLYVDQYRYLIGGHSFGRQESTVTIESRWLGTERPPNLDDIPLIATRVGVDLNPVDVTSAQNRRWLTALVWPEDHAGARLLDAALEHVAADPPDIVAGDAIDVCSPLGRNLPPGEPRVVFHAATRMHVPTRRRAAFDEAIDSIGDDGPLYHVWQEPPSAQHHGQLADDRGVIAFHGPGDSKPTSLVQVDGHLNWLAPLHDT